MRGGADIGPGRKPFSTPSSALLFGLERPVPRLRASVFEMIPDPDSSLLVRRDRRAIGGGTEAGLTPAKSAKSVKSGGPIAQLARARP